ncbi:hypothetical protein Dole_0685 [Desulfosudis oleivorans Hxd3]|uniref:Uncharacterized protein n=1 Tax=Desulfosudis oleivorans (strain DSM 6200 / JCM 39069 / Hxd3) TaxID=96561 RepID=A8ZUT2_DESOH|nr:hypothetical protein Dole_0685 [Desulfosudis oleivorans Hxd3]
MAIFSFIGGSLLLLIGIDECLDWINGEPYVFWFLHIPGGLLMLFIGYRIKKGNPNNFICSSCFKVSFKHQLKQNKCPHCNGQIELLDGFYDRHPEKK